MLFKNIRFWGLLRVYMCLSVCVVCVKVGKHIWRQFLSSTVLEAGSLVYHHLVYLADRHFLGFSCLHPRDFPKSPGLIDLC